MSEHSSLPVYFLCEVGGFTIWWHYCRSCHQPWWSHLKHDTCPECGEPSENYLEYFLSEVDDLEDDDLDVCHHGVGFDEECDDCDYEIALEDGDLAYRRSKQLRIKLPRQTAALGGVAGGRRVSMPGLRRLVLPANHLLAAGARGISAEASMGSEHARSDGRALRAVRARLDDPFTQERGGVRGAARPALPSFAESPEACA